MNERQQALLIYLVEQDNRYHLTKTLAHQFDCSLRTIRNDLSTIEKEQASAFAFTLNRDPGKGILLAIDEEKKERLLKVLLQQKVQPTADVDLRQVAYELLMGKEKFSITGLTELYFLTKIEAKQLTDGLTVWFRRFQLSLTSKQRVGLILEGNELNKRRALAQIDDLSETPSGCRYLLSKMEPYEVSEVERQLASFKEKHRLFFTDESFQRLVMHVLLMVKRTKLNQPMTLTDEDLNQLKATDEYQDVLPLKASIESFFNVHLKDEEVAYLTMHMLGAKIKKGLNDTDFLNLAIENQAKALTEAITERLVQRMQVPFYDDPFLKEGLLVHVYTTINRLRFGLTVSNPLTKDIKQMYPYLFSVLLENVIDLEKDLGFLVPEEEVAYLALHYQAAFERLEKLKDKAQKTAIVCHMGIGMSEILKAKIESHFRELSIKATLQETEVHQYLKHEAVDFLISTLPLALEDPPHIVVSPLFTKTDEEKLQAYITVEEKTQALPEVDIKTLIEPAFIFLHYRFDHPYQLIEYVANRLVQAGVVEKEYVHQSLLRERKASTAIGGGMSVPHGDPRFVKQSTIAVITLKEPIDWDGEDVSLIFFVAIKREEKYSHRSLYQRLAVLAEQPSHVRRIIESETKKALLKIL